MAKSKFSDKLDGMKQNWEDSQNQYDSMFGGVKIDAGEYIARVQGAKVTESKASGKLMIRREHLIVEGANKGAVIFDMLMLETPMGLTFVRRWFEQMGYESPSDPSDIEEIVEAIAEEAATVKIAVKHSGDFINVAVIEVIADDEYEELNAETDEEKTAEKKPSGKAGKKKVEKEKEPEDMPEEEEAPEDDNNAELLSDMFAFCKSQDIDTEPDDDVEALGERISEYKWPEEELTDEEKEMFESAEIGDAIKKKAAKKKAKTKKQRRRWRSKKKRCCGWLFGKPAMIRLCERNTVTRTHLFVKLKENKK